MNASTDPKIVWVTWERQLRNRSMSKGLSVPLFEMLSRRGRIGRYASCFTQTIVLLWRIGPEVVICQNPSIILTLLLLVLRPVSRSRVVIDAHFGGVDASNWSGARQGILDWCNRKADLVIVTNENHAGRVRGVGGTPFICPDPLPDLSRYRTLEAVVTKKVFVICSFDPDEPFREVFKAAELLVEEGYRFFVSGNYRKEEIDPREFPNVEMLGFVSEDDFYGHLFSSQIVVDLTNNDDCLVCGAYEAMEAAKPLVLSDKKALREYFTAGVVFTENRAADIAAAVRSAFEVNDKLSRDARAWLHGAQRQMEERLTELQRLLAGLTRG